MSETPQFKENFIFEIRTEQDFSDSDWKHLATITRQAFAERMAQGLNMMPCHITAHGLRKKSDNCFIFCAIAKDNNKIVSYLVMGAQRDTKNTPYYDLKIAVSVPEIKRSGIASRLFSIAEIHARENGCVYIASDTSVKANSSVNWHKKLGFTPWRYTHFAHTNYYSVIFRKYLTKQPNRFLSSIFRGLSWCKTHLRYNEVGQSTAFTKLIHPCTRKPKKNGKLLSLTEVQQLAYNILQDFINICEKHNLRYLLCYGTLIGAIRHKGFIPWDDDIDVTMPLPDYENFLQIFEHENSTPHLNLLTLTKGDVDIPFAMLADNRTRTITPGRDALHEKPLAIDIFPAYAVSDTIEEVKQQVTTLQNETKTCYRSHQTWRKNPLKTLYILLFANKEVRSSLSKINDILHKHAWGTTQNVRIFSLDEQEPLLLPSNCFDCCSTCQFENLNARIPKEYDKHLTECYGNYMELPPKEKRTPCLDKCYWVSDTPIPEITLRNKA